MPKDRTGTFVGNNENASRGRPMARDGPIKDAYHEPILREAKPSEGHRDVFQKLAVITIASLLVVVTQDHSTIS